LILLDHMMPEMDGIETLKKVRESETNRCRKTPVIALTANAFSGVREMYLSEGFDDYLSKPINGKQLEEMLLTHLPKEKLLEAEPMKYVPAEKQKEEAVGKALLNSDKGLEYCANSPEVYVEILSMFCALRETSEKEMAGYLETRDWKNYTIKVHALKTNARSIGADFMGELCYELELAGKKIQAGEDAKGQEDLITEKHPEMLEVFDRTVAAVKEYMENRKGA